MKKSSEQQVNVNTDIEIKVLGKSFWGHEVGYKMLSPTPGVILHYINQHNAGIRLEVITMRDEPALTCDPDFTCPLTSGIFLRIVAEMNYEKYAQGAPLETICPFWRIINPTSKLGGKLSFGTEFIREMRQKEKID